MYALYIQYIGCSEVKHWPVSAYTVHINKVNKLYSKKRGIKRNTYMNSITFINKQKDCIPMREIGNAHVERQRKRLVWTHVNDLRTLDANIQSLNIWDVSTHVFMFLFFSSWMQIHQQHSYKYLHAFKVLFFYIFPLAFNDSMHFSWGGLDIRLNPLDCWWEKIQREENLA